VTRNKSEDEEDGLDDINNWVARRSKRVVNHSAQV
jgi:hypothetical protein